jgi:hypothetical protein
MGRDVQPTGFVRAMVAPAATVAAEPDARANGRMVSRSETTVVSS